MLARDFAACDGEVARDARFGREQVVVVRIETAGGGVEADGEEFAIRVVQEAERHPGGPSRGPIPECCEFARRNRRRVAMADRRRSESLGPTQRRRCRQCGADRARQFVPVSADRIPIAAFQGRHQCEQARRHIEPRRFCDFDRFPRTTEHGDRIGESDQRRWRGRFRQTVFESD